NVPALLTTLWHQSSPYNDKCQTLANGDHAATGCIATATAQIVYYWRRDANQTLAQTTPTYTYGDAPCTEKWQLKAGTPIKYDLMLDEYGNQPAEYRDAVATLVAACGMTAWLTYGSSTSGQIADCVNVFGAQFGINGGTCVYKDGNYTEAGWSQLLYNQLIKGRPMLYCGYNNSNGGHAVVCDGYQASTGFFHINFGWGSGYNGYLSVEDGVQGWNFNDSYQGCVYDIYPKRPNVKVQVSQPHTVYAKAENKFLYTVTNRGTLAINGLYLFCNTTGVSPTSLASATASATDLTIATDATQTLSLTAQPTTTGKNYLILTDDALHVLAKTEIEAESNDARLVANGLRVMTSAEVEEHDGELYGVGYYTRSTVQATVRNTSSVSWSGDLLLNYYQWNDETHAWDFLVTKKLPTTIAANAEATASAYITGSFNVGEHYCVELSDSISATQRIELDPSANHRALFTLRKNDMSVLGYENRVLRLGGHFDYTLFNTSTFAKKTAYSDATAYDLTQCTGVQEVPSANNPNALFYVANDAAATGLNVIRDGHSALISLTAGHDFQPVSDFVADSVRLTLNLTPAQWQFVTVPCRLNVPTGMIARQITTHKANSLVNCTADVTTLEPGYTYLIMTTADRHQTLTGSATNVVREPNSESDFLYGTFTAITTSQTVYMPDNASPQMFVANASGTTIPAMGGYLQASNYTKSFSTNSSLIYDAAYETLATNIATAYDILDQYAATVTSAAYSAYSAQIAEAVAIFSDRSNSPSSNEIRALANALLTSGEDYKKQVGDAGNCEIDFTSSIVNPSFETKSTTGWTIGQREGYSETGSVVNGTSANAYRGVGLDGQYLFRSLITQADSTSVSLQQTITGLTPGYYRLSAMVGTDAGHTVTLFAGDSLATVSGHPFGPLYLTQATINNIKVVADDASATGSLTIGIREGRWYKADAFTLTYTGNLKIDDTTADAI
ncbi:MAG: C10 family peptidase, partial [Bacteroidales bacterium]|nr:C10 family peptidase [Bacteroidales bacterium]